MYVRYMISLIVVFLMQGCVSTVQPLPSKCGQYDIVYGTVDGHGVFRNSKNEQVNILGTIDLNPYALKTLLLYGEYMYQRGGLLMPDGSDASFHHINLLNAHIIQVVENGQINHTKLNKVCSELSD